MTPNDDGIDVFDYDQCSGRNRNSERLLRLYLLGDGVRWAWMSLRLRRFFKSKIFRQIKDSDNFEIKINFNFLFIFASAG